MWLRRTARLLITSDRLKAEVVGPSKTGAILDAAVLHMSKDMGGVLTMENATSTIIVTPADPHSVRRAYVAGAAAVLIEGEESRLPGQLAQVMGIVRGVALPSDLPVVVRAGVRIILASVHPRSPPVSSLSDAARRVGCSPDHLARIARDHIDFRTLIDSARAIRALRLKAQGKTWEAVAREMGFAGASGLTALFHRTFSCPPSHIPPGAEEHIWKTIDAEIHSLSRRSA